MKTNKLVHPQHIVCKFGFILSEEKLCKVIDEVQFNMNNIGSMRNVNQCYLTEDGTVTVNYYVAISHCERYSLNMENTINISRGSEYYPK